MNFNMGDMLVANCNYYSKLSGRKLFTRGNEYAVRVGTDGKYYVTTDLSKSRELTVILMATIFDKINDNYDYAMGIL